MLQKAIKYNLSDSTTRLYEKYKSIIRFIIVGCVNTGVDFLAFTLVHSFWGLNKLFCQTAGYSMGIINSFILNKLWTFENRDSKFSTFNQAVCFIIVNMVSLGVSLLGLKLISEVYGVNVYVAKLMVTAIVQAVNYTGYKLLVFKKEK